MLAEVISKGTKELHGPALADYLDEHGMDLNVTAGFNSVDLRITCFPEDAFAAANLLVNMIKEPAYNENDVILAQRAQASLVQPEDERHWSEVLHQEVMSGLLAIRHLVGSLRGTKRGLPNVTKAIIDELKVRLMVTGNTIFSLNGGFDREKLPDRVWSMMKEALSQPVSNSSPHLFHGQKVLNPRFCNVTGSTMSLAPQLSCVRPIWRPSALMVRLLIYC